jgi:1,2-phenylacetyl-CoA epoxidase catalytic subunit
MTESVVWLKFCWASGTALLSWLIRWLFDFLQILQLMCFGCSFGRLTHVLAAALQEVLSHRQVALSACEESAANSEVGKWKGAAFYAFSV